VWPEPRTFVASIDQSGLTVLAALRQWLPGQSWSAVRKLVADRHVVVNGSLCLDEARRIKTGETVTLYGSQLRPPPTKGDVPVVWLDRDVIVVDKPHKDFPTFGEQRPVGIYSVHRIDRDTSGLVVFARNPNSRDVLIGQFKKHTIERTYLAVACGEVAAGTIRSYLVDDRGDGKRGSAENPGVGKLAVTHLRPLEALDGFTLVECRLETGRTHQIRIHLSEAGHPVYGDVKYGAPESRTDEKSGVRSLGAALPRLALHASTLGFHQPTSGERLRFESPLPPDFLALLERLRRRSHS
jgi:23S rRNA pseudouridine1911/1915/1917 synthase